MVKPTQALATLSGLVKLYLLVLTTVSHDWCLGTTCDIYLSIIVRLLHSRAAFCRTLCALGICTRLNSMSHTHNPHTPTPTHNPLQSFHTHSITSCRLSVSSWATLGQVVSLLSESMVLEMVPSGWMTSSVLGMRVLWHCVLLVDGQIMTAHMCRMQGLYVQVGTCMTGLTTCIFCFGYVLVMSIFVLVVSMSAIFSFVFPSLLFFSPMSFPSTLSPHSHSPHTCTSPCIHIYTPHA